MAFAFKRGLYTQEGVQRQRSREPARQVFISQSNDVFTNLALEDWIYRNLDFKTKHLLLLWRNDPCVVIGRHQNPWTEANVPFLRENGVSLARRNSGGGTVYHDQGNINCTFFSTKADYKRRRNLDIVCAAIRRLTSLDVGINDREDIVLNQTHKISGTAAKLGPKAAYHHCTVLVDVNTCMLHDALGSRIEEVETRATQSIRVPVKNLRDADPTFDVNQLEEAVGWEFLRTDLNGVDVGMKAAKNQRGFTLVNPEEGWFKGIDKLRDDLASPRWVFGKTPKFKLSRGFTVPEELFESSATQEIRLEIEVHYGVIEDVRTQLPMGLLDPEFDLSEALHGMVFGEGLLKAVAKALDANKVHVDKKEFLVDCLRKMIGEVV